VQDILQETGFYRQWNGALVGIPEDLRRYVKVDVEAIAEECVQGLHAMETNARKVWVFQHAERA
jgi:hypothetical protein